MCERDAHWIKVGARLRVRKRNMASQYGKNMQLRMMKIMLIFFALFLVILGRYIWVETVLGQEMKKRSQYQVREQVAEYLPRGIIYDRNHRTMAISVMTKSLYVDPSHVQKPKDLAAQLAPILQMPAQEIVDKIGLGGGFVWLKREMTPEQTKAVENLIKQKHYYNCLGMRKESKRYYPNNELSANVIGFVGTDHEGLDGVEQSLNDVLKGNVIRNYLSTDMHNRPILDSILHTTSASPDHCKNVVLTIDSTIQFITEQALDKAMVDYQPANALAIVMDPKTGEVLAMACRPSYNPNAFWKYKPTAWKNRCISYVYEPGSTFKAVVAAAALQKKIIAPNDTFVDPGVINVADRHIQNWNGESFGTVTFTDIVRESLNTGFVYIGMKLGGPTLIDYAKKFGFGRVTGIDLPGEERGILFDPKDMTAPDVAVTSIGQGIAVTPLQMITAMAAIANDGVLLKPRIVRSIYNHDGSLYKRIEPQEIHRCIDSSTDKTLTMLLEKVVSSGSGQKAAVAGYHIAGKTGTAQKVDMVHGGYMPGKYVASFCGFAPTEDPRVVVLVVVDDPHKGSYYGGQVAAPIAKEIFSKVFRYLHIAPSVPVVEDLGTAPNVTKAVPVPATPYPKNVPPGMVVVPKVLGKTIRQATEILVKAGLDINVIGSGICTEQNPAYNSIAPPGMKIEVHFSP